MSDPSLKSFLGHAKRHLRQALMNNGTASFVVGNESADLDSITCALLYAYTHSNATQSRQANAIVIPVTNIPASDLPLRPELTALLKHTNIRPSDLITLDDLGTLPLSLRKCDWTLVDHNEFHGALAEYYSAAVTGVIDHHDDEGTIPKTASPRIIGKSGSCNSLVVNYCRSIWDNTGSALSSIRTASGEGPKGVVDDAAHHSAWDIQMTKLSLASILIDTYNMTNERKVTNHDRKAVQYLEASINALSEVENSYDRKVFFEEINAAKSDLDGLEVLDILRKDYKQWSDDNITLGISSVVKPVQYLRDKEAHFGKTVASFAERHSLDLFAIMTAYTSENGRFCRQLLLVCLREDAVNAMKQFAEGAGKDELNLQDSGLDVGNLGDCLLSFRLWQQLNVTASRKRVAPLLRKAMR